MNANNIFIIATHNEHKVGEFRALLRDFPFELKSLLDVGFATEIDETGCSFAENANLKLEAIAKEFPEAYVLADDSGLCIDALSGAPGVYSARFGGVESTYPEKFSILWKELSATGVPREQWDAHFICHLALACPDGRRFQFEGRFSGKIHDCVEGEHGFGYDPIFYLPEYGCTAAMLEPDEKNRISHRGKALQQLLSKLQELQE